MVAQPWWTQLKSITLHTDTESPQLWPDGVSPEYVNARLALHEVEIALRDQVETVAAMRRALPAGTVIDDYDLVEGPTNLDARGPIQPVRLSELFGEHDTLVIYHLMFHPEDDQACAMCSLWVDGLKGTAQHITRRTGLAIVAKAPIDKLRDWGRRRGWQGLRLASSSDSTFSRDLYCESETGGQWPSFAVFQRDGDTLRHTLTQCADLPDGERGNDLLSPVWNVFDLLPQGRGDWLPDNDYPLNTNQIAAAKEARQER